MIECNDLFDYGYKIYQNKDYFKFSLDSLLLGEFIDFKENDKILDMCTGNAPIPLLLSSKNNNLDITCLEIQKEVYELAKKSINLNNLTNIKIINIDIKDYTTKEKYNIITCNPPYFKVNNKSLINENEIKSIARHELTITLEEIIAKSKQLLNDNGDFYLVHRTERLLETISLLETYHLGIRKLCFIFTKTKSNAEFFLVKSSKNKKSDPKITYLNIQNLKTYQNIFKEENK